MISFFLSSLAQRSPLLLVLLVGIGFAVVRWRRHPKASLIAVIGLGLYLVKVFVFTILNYSIPRIRVSMGLSYAASNHLFEALGFLSDVVLALTIILLVAAAFAGRERAAATN